MVAAPPPETLSRDPSRLGLFTLVTGGHPGPLASGEQRATVDQVARWGMKRQLMKHALRYRHARAVTRDLTELYNPLKTATFLRLLARGRCWVEDDSGAKQAVTAGYLAALAGRFAMDRAGAGQTLRDVDREVSLLSSAAASAPEGSRPTPGAAPPLYLRSDLIFDVDAGGAVAHIGGVVNNLEFRGHRPVMATTAPIPLVDPALEVHVIAPSRRPAVADDIWRLGFNKEARAKLTLVLAGRAPAFVYHRANAYSYVGALLAHDLGAPFVLEYNGSDAWISRNWGHQPIRRESLVLRIEELNLRAACLIVVVSQALASELVGRGVPAERVLVAPNGVDPERFRPGIDGSLVRARYGIGAEEIVVGFVGSFGAWHGAEVLAKAFARLIGRGDVPLRLLMVGDGSRLPAVRSILGPPGLADRVVLTGLVPQAEGPAHMAACDILVAPHVANTDGSAFFGSPTKLFEYLAMGKAVIASALDQLGQVVVDNVNGLSVPPGDDDALAGAIARLAVDAGLRQRLGQQARHDAEGRHTWRQHADAITARLEELLQK